MKDRRLRGELKECVPIKPLSLRFKYNYKRKSHITVERKQFPLVIGHAITIHKSQGSTLEYMKGDLDQTSNNPKYSAPIGPGMIYTLLSRAKSRDRIHLLNFKEDQIKVNQNAVEEMKRMREESKFSWNHPLKIPGKKIKSILDLIEFPNTVYDPYLPECTSSLEDVLDCALISLHCSN